MSSDIIGGLSSICLRYGVDALYVFGSRAPEIAGLVRKGDPSSASGDRRVRRPRRRLLRDMAGYRNRPVHFYSEVTPQELFHIRSSRLTGIEKILSALLQWLGAHPELMNLPSKTS